ncbi:hypothetical protein M422DRAFT_53966 [Sphaerobolus stellatus SS14]|uniref:Uncharacterized protein n=1 Tax=Sphaerobolus stellatus (strain SS14) TaxID=990650 RepID=A0A0C9UXY9_SPHS4|nr:hypothetical protein M422DRAFT_53966 [Sphaerobolus stellatus SS14]
MTASDPSKRPTMDVAVERFEKIVEAQTEWALRSRLITRGEPRRNFSLKSASGIASKLRDDPNERLIPVISGGSPEQSDAHPEEQSKEQSKNSPQSNLLNSLPSNPPSSPPNSPTSNPTSSLTNNPSSNPSSSPTSSPSSPLTNPLTSSPTKNLRRNLPKSPTSNPTIRYAILVINPV